jgi:hypothetical protein
MIKNRMNSKPEMSFQTLGNKSWQWEKKFICQITDEFLGGAYKSRFAVHPKSTKLYKDLKEYYWWWR